MSTIFGELEAAEAALELAYIELRHQATDGDGRRVMLLHGQRGNVQAIRSEIRGFASAILDPNTMFLGLSRCGPGAHELSAYRNLRLMLSVLEAAVRYQKAREVASHE